MASMAELLLPGGVCRGEPLDREGCLCSVDLVMMSPVPESRAAEGPDTEERGRGEGEADHLGIPLPLAFLPRVALRNPPPEGLSMRSS